MSYSEERFLQQTKKYENADEINEDELENKTISIDVEKDRTQLNGGNKKDYYYGKE